MTKWEYALTRAANPEGDYIVIKINNRVQDFVNHPQNISDVLNLMGNEGWELIAAYKLRSSSPVAQLSRQLIEYVLKRPIENKE